MLRGWRPTTDRRSEDWGTGGAGAGCKGACRCPCHPGNLRRQVVWNESNERTGSLPAAFPEAPRVTVTSICHVCRRAGRGSSGGTSSVLLEGRAYFGVPVSCFEARVPGTSLAGEERTGMNDASIHHRQDSVEQVLGLPQHTWVAAK
ncbi:hypothetical protein E2C01_067064 [Portunus trituberculatus]|uniref:Uncharacterized protein n=1 Tax=Portunus trituberculatus TaxID=210409 RepID=A0A5B7HJV4_PORTR|nr:hypothetical protein [Portunus trituberculatus]